MNARLQFETLVMDDDIMNTVIMSGPRDAGKSAAVWHVLGKHSSTVGQSSRGIHVVWVKANSLRDVEHLATVVEDALGVKWPELSRATVLLQVWL